MRSARCAICQQFVKVADASKTWDHFCHRCARVEDYYERSVRIGCEASVVDDSGDLEPCSNTHIWGIRWDTEFDTYYAVCKRHYAPPFDRCHEDEDTGRCLTHGGRFYSEVDYCDHAYTPAPAGVSAAPLVRDRPIGPAGAPTPTTSEEQCETCHRLLSCVGTCPKGCPQ